MVIHQPVWYKCAFFYRVFMVTFKDEQLGVISLIINRNAKRYSFSAKDGKLKIIAPPNVDGDTLFKIINDNRAALQDLLKKGQASVSTIDKDFSFENEFIKINFEATQGKSAIRNTEDGCYTLYYGESVDFTSPSVQNHFRKILENILKHRASCLLPKMAHELQVKHQLFARSVSISAARTRWGSCSGAGNISLSCYLLLTNKELVEYVICHELAHLKYMNHSEEFWKLVDTLVSGDSRALREKLKAFRTSF